MICIRAGAAIATLTLSLCPAMPALAQDGTLQAKPVTQWHAALEDGLCHLARTFSTGDAEIQFILRRRAPRYQFELNMVADNLERRNNTPLTQYGVDKEPLRHGYSYRLKDGDWEGFAANLPADYFDSPVQQSLIVKDAFEKDVALDLQNIGGALAVMDQCLDEVLRSWGLDPEEQRAVSRMVNLPERSEEILRHATFQTDRVRERLGQDSLYFVTMVDEEGRATSCFIEGAANDTSDGQAACRAIERSVRFEPALDTDGNPIASFFVIETALYTRTQFVF